MLPGKRKLKVPSTTPKCDTSSCICIGFLIRRRRRRRVKPARCRQSRVSAKACGGDRRLRCGTSLRPPLGRGGKNERARSAAARAAILSARLAGGSADIGAAFFALAAQPRQGKRRAPCRTLRNGEPAAAAWTTYLA